VGGVASQSGCASAFIGMDRGAQVIWNEVPLAFLFP
jgi:hypothetical protein